MAAAYFSSALSTASSLGSSLVARSTLSTNYAVQSTVSTSSAPGASSSRAVPVQIGVWKVERAVHVTNGKHVSIWTCDKSNLTSASGGSRRGASDPRRLDKAIEVLKKEAAFLSRLRHPCVLEVAEPMEETRSTITFATEPVTSSLRQAISVSADASSSRRRGGSDELELDEVEIQKGLSQVAKGLQFLHESAKLVHRNLTPESIVINAKGDWKLSGFGLATYLLGPDGVPAKWEYPEYDASIPSCVQLNYDYLAPEFLLDEANPSVANDLYALGCLLHQIHTKTGPPFSNRQSLNNARENLEEGLTRGMLRPQWRKLPEETQECLAGLLTRFPSGRLTATSFLNSRYFSSLLVSTLRFLERDSFATQTSEAQASFLKGLLGVLPQFSDKVNRRKILPSLLEETRKAGLVPFLLPNILAIAAKMDDDAFRTEVLPGLKPLFAMKEPPQALLALLDSLPLLMGKCTPGVFREEVMPLVYHSLGSEHPIVLENVLRKIPALSETIGFDSLKQQLLPQVMIVFSKTTMLSVKVNTLICFHSMVPILDKFTLTEKLVPLLSKIKTKEPAVMVATLAVHEAMGKKVTIEAIATLILPQLWQLSITPLLNADQFAKFVAVIDELGARVKREHAAHLAELRRLEETSGAAGGAGAGQGGARGDGAVDFESLVRGKGAAASKTEQRDVWADDSRSATPQAFSPPIQPTFSSPPLPATPAFPPTITSSASFGSSPSLGARPVPSSSFNSSAFATPASPPPPPPSNAVASFPVMSTLKTSLPAVPAQQPSAGLSSFQPMQPSRSTSGLASPPPPSNAPAYTGGKPNYKLGGALPAASSVFQNAAARPVLSAPNSFAASAPAQSAPPPLQATSSWAPMQPVGGAGMMSPPLRPTVGAGGGAGSRPAPPGFGGDILQPKKVGLPAPKNDFGAWADFDPLK